MHTSDQLDMRYLTVRDRMRVAAQLTVSHHLPAATVFDVLDAVNDPDREWLPLDMLDPPAMRGLADELTQVWPGAARHLLALADHDERNFR